MTFPAGLATVQVVGSFFDGGTRPQDGEVIFTPSAWLESNGVIIVRKPVVGYVREGVLDVTLLATDDADVQPAGWHWKVSVNVGGRRRAWATFLPSTPDPVDLEDLAPIEPVVEMVGYATLVQLTAEETARIAADAALDERIDDLEGGGGGGAPTGPAGGALAGTYPNPTLSAGTIASFDAAGAAAAAQAAAATDATTKVNAHEADTTNVHGIADTANLETQAGATAKVTTHTGATDPHADRAYTDTGLAGKANTSHTHAAADVDSGTLAAARLPDATSGAKGAVQLAGDLAGTAAAPTVPGLATEAVARAAADALLIPLTQKGAASGVATLDGAQKIPLSQLPAITLSSFLGTVASQAAMLALTGEEGDWAIRSDRSLAWIITGPDPTQLTSWTELPSPTDVVLSVNGEVGAVTLDATDVGAIAAAEKGANSGVATLDGGGDVPASQLGNVPATADATTGSKGVVQLAGDLAGTAAAPTVPGLAGKASAIDAIIEASAAGTRALIVQALQGATPPSGALFQVKDHAGTVLAEVTAGSLNLNVSPAAYSYVITGVRVYVSPTDPDAGAADGSLWIDTTVGVLRQRVAGAWVSTLTPGAWTSPTFQTGAGNAVVGNPTVDTPAFRLESTVSGVVRGRGSVGITGTSPVFAQAAVFMNIPAPLRPSVPRVMSIRTRGGTSTHTNLVVLTNGDVYCANTVLNTGSDVILDGVTYTL